MRRYIEIAAVVGPIALFRKPRWWNSNVLYYVDDNGDLAATPWTEVPSEAECAEWFGVLPWDEFGEPSFLGAFD
jgi:hypothetical protein